MTTVRLVMTALRVTTVRLGTTGGLETTVRHETTGGLGTTGGRLGTTVLLVTTVVAGKGMPASDSRMALVSVFCVE